MIVVLFGRTGRFMIHNPRVGSCHPTRSSAQVRAPGDATDGSWVVWRISSAFGWKGGIHHSYRGARVGLRPAVRRGRQPARIALHHRLNCLDGIATRDDMIVVATATGGEGKVHMTPEAAFPA